MAFLGLAAVLSGGKSISEISRWYQIKKQKLIFKFLPFSFLMVTELTTFYFYEHFPRQCLDKLLNNEIYIAHW